MQRDFLNRFFFFCLVLSTPQAKHHLVPLYSRAGWHLCSYNKTGKQSCMLEWWVFFASGARRNFFWGRVCLFSLRWLFTVHTCYTVLPSLCLTQRRPLLDRGPPWPTQNKYVFNQLLISGITVDDWPATEQSRKKEQNTKYEGSREGSRLLEACSASQ